LAGLNAVLHNIFCWSMTTKNSARCQADQDRSQLWLHSGGQCRNGGSVMRILSKLNGIAARIGIAIILAIFLGIVMTIGLSVGVNHYFRSGVATRGPSYVLFSRSGFGVVTPYMNPTMLSGKIAMIIRAAASSPDSASRKFIAAIASPEMQIAFDEPAQPNAATDVDENLDRLRQLVQMQLDGLSSPILVGARRLPPRIDEATDRDPTSSASRGGAVVEAALPDGQRLSVTIPDYPVQFGGGLVLFLISMVIVAVLVSIWTARRLARPIREFARASERLGVGLTAPPLAISGPQELRTTITAFNRMQDRLKRFLEDRTQMLAAISHDLRAPLARLRLRAELVTDGEQQRRMFDDLDVMDAMIDSTLAFARDDSRQEPRRLVDLGVLVGDICEDVADTGGKVSNTGRRGINVSCRPTLIRRAVANLIDNAVKYGGSARVDILRETERVVVVIDDDGPGIPPQEQEKVFAPFYRLEAARDPGKAGIGLGLSIARTVAREHGGDVMLKNRDNGGLSALIELPA
jgi:signal transduction histidine kinase/disulfide bond formation protein DsbB